MKIKHEQAIDQIRYYAELHYPKDSDARKDTELCLAALSAAIKCGHHYRPIGVPCRVCGKVREL